MRFININKKIKSLLNKLFNVSVMPGVPTEFTVLDKAEEELEECLIEIRKVKTHFNAMKAERKSLNENTRKSAVKNLVNEIGDVYVDLFLALPVILPDISIEDIEKRIKEKLDIYQKAYDKIIKKNNQIVSAAEQRGFYDCYSNFLRMLSKNSGSTISFNQNFDFIKDFLNPKE